MRAMAGAVKDAVWRTLPTEIRGVDEGVEHLPYTVVAQRGPMRVLYFAPRGE